LSLLSLPFEKIHLYGAFSPEQEYLDGNVQVAQENRCWGVLADANYSIWDRVAGSGILAQPSGASSAPNEVNRLNDSASVYRPNEAGVAYLRIAQFLSRSSPLATSVERATSKERAEREQYFVRGYRDGDGHQWLGLWWYPTFTHGPVSRFFDWITGVGDLGFQQTRVHRLSLKGHYVSAQMIRLDIAAASPSSLWVQYDALNDQTWIEGVEFGEFPVLVRLTPWTAIEEYGRAFEEISSKKTKKSSRTPARSQ